MAEKTETFRSADGNLELLVYIDGSKAELKISEGSKLTEAEAIEELLSTADIKYGFNNARTYCQKNNISRAAGEFFPVALADDTDFIIEVEILLEPMDCLLSQNLQSLSDLTNVRYINAGEKLAKIKTGDGKVQSKNIFDRKIKDLAQDQSFLDTYLGENVEYDMRRNIIIASIDGYGLVENNQKISLIDNILLQQDVVEVRNEIKTSLTIDGSVISSDLVIGGDLKVLGSIENCHGRGIVVTGSLVAESAKNSLLICKGDFDFNDKLIDCEIYCNCVVKGGNLSIISGGKVEAGIAISADSIGDDQKPTTAEICIAPFLKGMMIQMSQELRKKGWDPQDPDTEDPLVKELADLELRYSKVIPDFLSYHRDENKIISNKGFVRGTSLRIFDLIWDLDEDSQLTDFSLNTH